MVSSCNIDWCKTIPTNTGWVSENYLVSRIIKWLYTPYLANKLENTKYERTNYLAKNIIHGLHLVIAGVMDKMVTDNKINDIDRKLKIFMTDNKDFEDELNKIHPKKKKLYQKPSWIQKYNFQSLLNISDVMKTYEPITNLWEVSTQGEGYLRLAEPKITSIHVKNWHLHAHKKYWTFSHAF